MIVYLSKHDVLKSVPMELCIKYLRTNSQKKIIVIHGNYNLNSLTTDQKINICFKRLPLLFFIIRKFIDFLLKINLINVHWCFFLKELNFDIFSCFKLFFCKSVSEIHSPFYTPITFFFNNNNLKVYHPMNPCDIDIYNWTIVNTNILNEELKDVYENKFRLIAIKRFLFNTDKIVGFNEYVLNSFKKYINQYNFDLELDIRIQKFDLELRLDNKSNKLGFISAPFKIKGLDLILESNFITNYGIDVVGDWRNIQSAIKKGINLLGILKNKNRDNWYKKMGIIIVPSYFDGMPRVIMEAINFGCIVLCSDTCGYSFFLDKSQIFKSGSIIDLESKLKHLLGLSYNQRKNLITNSLHIIKKLQ